MSTEIDTKAVTDAVEAKMAEYKTELASVDEKLESAVKKYDGQLGEAKSADTEIRNEVKALADKGADLEAKIADLMQKNQAGIGQRTEHKTIGQTLIESEAFKAMATGASSRVRLEVKNTILGEEGSPGEPSNVLVPEQRLPGIVSGAFRSLNLLDVVPTGTTASNQIQYTRELSFTNAAAETSEGAQKPETDLTFELVEEPVRTIAHWIKLSRQVLDDAPALQSYVDRRLRHGVQRRLQSQMIAGDGNAPNLLGINSATRSTPFVADTGDQELDSLNKMKYAVIGADYEPNIVLINPADWGSIERLKDDSGAYLAGNGAALSYINNGMTPVVWGLPVIANNDVPSGNAFVLDINEIQLFLRSGAVVEMFEQDETNVQQNLITVRAEIRAALASFTQPAIRYGALTVT